MRVLTAYYDLAVGPVSFDFVTFMVKAELARRRAGAERLHMVIVPFSRGLAGMFRDKSQFYDEHEARWRLWNICIPACALIGASVTLATDWEQAKRLRTPDVWPPDWDRQTLKDRRHLVGDVIAAAKAGARIPVLEASEQARRNVRAAYAKLGKPVVTVTLRSTYLRERNSDRGMWQRVMRYVESRGYAIALLEDTSVALANGVGYGELNLDVRVAMYQEAALNIVPSNGPASICWFSERPYLMFGAGVPADEWDGLFVKQGLPLGQTWPWARPGQKIAYGPTTEAQVVAEFDAWAQATS